jgi:hypothetical protein
MEEKPSPVHEGHTMSDTEIPIPPASFEFLTLSLKMQAEMQLGLMNFGEDDKSEPDFRLARHSIDMLAMLQEKTRGNLSIEEQRLLENALTELRFRFVQGLEARKSQPAAESGGSIAQAGE